MSKRQRSALLDDGLRGFRERSTAAQCWPAYTMHAAAVHRAGAEGPSPFASGVGNGDAQGSGLRQVHGQRGYHTFWMAEHHFQPEGTELIPNLLMMAMHLCGVTKNLNIGCGFNIVPMWHPVRLAEDYAMADILTGGRVIFGVGRGYHTRGVETLARCSWTRTPTARSSRRVSRSCSRRSRAALLAPGQVLHEPAGGPVSRLRLEGNYLGAGAGAPVGRMCRCYTSSTVA